MLPIRNKSYLLPMCCSFLEKCKNSPKTGLGCSTPLKLHGIKLISCVYRIITFYYNVIPLYWFNELRPKDDAVIPRWVMIKNYAPRATNTQIMHYYQNIIRTVHVLRAVLKYNMINIMYFSSTYYAIHSKNT